MHFAYINYLQGSQVLPSIANLHCSVGGHFVAGFACFAIQAQEGHVYAKPPPPLPCLYWFSPPPSLTSC